MERTDKIDFNVKSLYNSNYAKGVRDFLNLLTVEALYSIAHTACGQKIRPENKEEAVEVILLYTSDIDRFFSYRRITMDILTRYVHINGQTISKHATHHHLVTSVKKLWAKKHFSHENSERRKKEVGPLTTENERISPEESDQNIHLGQTVRSDKFAHDFSGWFYSCLNNTLHNSYSRKNRIDASMFCLNASLDLYRVNPNSSKDVHSVGAEDCEKALHEFVSSSRFMCTPNLDTGTQAVKSSHGLTKVLCCGTLHMDKNFVGIFEQEFGLVQSPVDRNWKIFYSKANFREGISVLPSLPPSSVFEIKSL